MLMWLQRSIPISREQEYLRAIIQASSANFGWLKFRREFPLLPLLLPLWRWCGLFCFFNKNSIICALCRFTSTFGLFSGAHCRGLIYKCSTSTQRIECWLLYQYTFISVVRPPDVNNIRIAGFDGGGMWSFVSSWEAVGKFIVSG